MIASVKKNSFSAWDLNQGKILKTFEGHSKEVWSVNCSHDSKLIVSGSSDNTAIIWDAETANTIRKLKKHSQQVYFVEFSYDDRYVLTVSADGSMIVWNSATGEDIVTRRTSTTPNYTNMFCPNAPMYIVADGSTIHIYHMHSPSDLIQILTPRYVKISFTSEEKEYYSL